MAKMKKQQDQKNYMRRTHLSPTKDSTAKYDERNEFLTIKWDIDHGVAVHGYKRKRYEELREKYG